MLKISTRWQHTLDTVSQFLRPVLDGAQRLLQVRLKLRVLISVLMTSIDKSTNLLMANVKFEFFLHGVLEVLNFAA